MNIFLDTHTFIWYISGSTELSPLAKQVIENPQNQSFVSIVSLWEISIKISLGKLVLESPFETIMDDISKNGFEIFPITFDHALQNSRLQWHHKDPFDRLLAAQCLVENMPLIGRDVIIDLYFEGHSALRVW